MKIETDFSEERSVGLTTAKVFNIYRQRGEGFFRRFGLQATPGDPFIENRAFWLLLAGIIFLGFLFRVYLALSTTYIYDEDREWIGLALFLSADPQAPYLPVMGKSHGAISAYLIRAGVLLFGENPLGFRFLSIIAGALTILCVSLITRREFGNFAAIVAAILVAFNEYHIMVSAIAIQKPFYLAFCAAAILYFQSAMRDDSNIHLVISAVFVALAFSSYAITFLLVVAILVAVLTSPAWRGWIFKPYAYIAAFVAVIVALPVILANLAPSIGNASAAAVHGGRYGGLGFTELHFAFFFRDVMGVVYQLLGKEFLDLQMDYKAMNVIFGATAFFSTTIMSIAVVVIKGWSSNPLIRFLVTLFWIVFLFFSFLSAG